MCRSTLAISGGWWYYCHDVFTVYLQRDDCKSNMRVVYQFKSWLAGLTKRRQSSQPGHTLSIEGTVEGVELLGSSPSTHRRASASASPSPSLSPGPSSDPDPDAATASENPLPRQFLNVPEAAKKRRGFTRKSSVDERAESAPEVELQSYERM